MPAKARTPTRADAQGDLDMKQLSSLAEELINFIIRYNL
jgi:hypothetical protein